MKIFYKALSLAIFFLVLMSHNILANDTREEILELQDTLGEKKSRLSELQSQIGTLQRKISQEQTKQITLENQLALLENRIAKAGLDIEAKQVEIDSVTVEIDILNQEVTLLDGRIENQKEILVDLLQEIKNNDQKSSLELLLTTNRFSDFYTQVKFIEDIQQDLQDTIENVRELKSDEEIKRNQLEDHRLSLENLRVELEQNKAQLEEEQGTKEYLIASAAASETRFQNLLRELRAESQFVDNQINSLEGEISNRLRQYDISGGSVISWPLDNHGIMTVGFRDPDYPFRYLFEHSGIDIATRKGTPVKSAAPGIVAVARTGRLYGNYVIVIHPNGISTLYAHLSRIMVKPEEFVERGEVVGFSGGVRGEAGSGFSTGPHLHFEVRSNGIPVDPMDYLISL